MTTIVAKENVYENCNVNKNIIVNEKSSEIKDAVVINVCSNCNNNIIELSCCNCNEKISCNFGETVFKISIKQKQLFLTNIVPYWPEVISLIVSFLMCEIFNEKYLDIQSHSKTLNVQNKFENFEFFIQIEYSEAIRFSMVISLLRLFEMVISSSFKRKLFKLSKNKVMFGLSSFFTFYLTSYFTIYFTSEVFGAEQFSNQIKQHEHFIMYAELLPFYPIKNGGSDVLFYSIFLSLKYLNESGLSKISLFSLKRANRECLIYTCFHALFIDFLRMKYSFWNIETTAGSEISSAYRYALNFALTRQRNFKLLTVFLLFFFSRIIFSSFLLFCFKKRRKRTINRYATELDLEADKYFAQN